MSDAAGPMSLGPGLSACGSMGLFSLSSATWDVCGGCAGNWVLHVGDIGAFLLLPGVGSWGRLLVNWKCAVILVRGEGLDVGTSAGFAFFR